MITAKSFVRRAATLAAAAALISTVAACGSSETGGSAAQVTDLKVGSAPSLSGLGLQAGISEGQFTEQGLTVTAVPNKSANEAIPQLLNGNLQLAQVDTVTLLQASTQGLPVKIVAGAGVQSTNGEDGEMSSASVVALSNSAVKSSADLAGRKVGVSALKTQTWMNIRAIVDAVGADSSTIEFVEVPPAQMIDLVTRGDVDAAAPNEPLASSSIAAGKVTLVHNTDAPGNEGVPGAVYVATEEFIAKNPETVQKFATAVQDAAKELNGNRELATQIAQEQLDYKPEQLEHAFFQTFATDPVTPEEIDKVSGLAVKYEILSEAPDAQGLLAQQQ